MSGFHHEAVFYASDDEYLAALLPDLRSVIRLHMSLDAVS